MKHSRTAYVALGMLAIEPNKSGYDIRKAIESSVGYFWGESYGQIYPALKRLAADGLIVPSSPPAKQRRQEYSITEAGRACLQEWLALPFQNDPPRNEFLLKLFFSGDAAPGVAMAHIRELNARNRSSLATMQHIETLSHTVNTGNPRLRYWMLTLGLGIAMTHAALEWGERSLASLEAEDTAATNQPLRNIQST